MKMKMSKMFVVSSLRKTPHPQQRYWCCSRYQRWLSYYITVAVITIPATTVGVVQAFSSSAAAAVARGTFPITTMYSRRRISASSSSIRIPSSSLLASISNDSILGNSNNSNTDTDIENKNDKKNDETNDDTTTIQREEDTIIAEQQPGEDRRKSSSSTRRKRTQYTIDDTVCVPTDVVTLTKAVERSCRTFDKYLDKRPIAVHTRRAFETLLAHLDSTQHKNYHGLVLDSGCGTGRSTKLLAKQIHPQHLVIGIDRSFARLTKTQANRPSSSSASSSSASSSSHPSEEDDDGGDGDDDDSTNDNTTTTNSTCSPVSFVPQKREIYCHQIADNAYLVRAELVDFWRLCIEYGWTTTTTTTTAAETTAKTGEDDHTTTPMVPPAPSSTSTAARASSSSALASSLHITHHYLLYPNPYPTKARLSKRWYGHPCFPLFWTLNSHSMTTIIRSNWEQYLIEFAQAIVIANNYYDDQNLKKNRNTTTKGATTQGDGKPTIEDATMERGRSKTATMSLFPEDSAAAAASSASSSAVVRNFVRPYVAAARRGPHERLDKALPYTNFEIKYDTSEESTYELILATSSSASSSS